MKKRISLLFCLICLSLTLVTAQKEITLQAIWKSATFVPRMVRGFASMPQSDYYSTLSRNGIHQNSFKTGEEVKLLLSADMLVTASQGALKISDLSDYSFDKSCTKILLSFDEEYIYRRSTCAYYYVYDLKTNRLQQISSREAGKISFADFSEDGSKVAFVRDYNLYYFDLQTQKEVQITTDGKENHILNGFADWVHEEELSMSQCFTWSPDGTKIAYLRFDESAVKQFSMTIWGELYPEEYTYKYPKAGEDNSIVDIYVYDLNQAQTQKLHFDREDCYYPRMYWLPNSTDLVILKLNRLQNQLDFYQYNVTNHQKSIVLTDKNAAWLDITDDYYFLKDGKSMIFTSERDGYNHIYFVEFGKTPVQLTQGNFEVKQISAIDPDKQLIYYLSNESHVLNQDLYVINFAGKKKKCLTSGTGWNSPVFNDNAHFYCNNYSDSKTAPIYTVHDATGKLLYTLEDNAAFMQRTAEYGYSHKELFSFHTEDGIALNGWMIKPLDFDAKKKYPVLMYVYGGPGSQEVSNAYYRGLDYAWYQMLAQKGYIVVCVDGRGTAGRGDAFKKVIYKQMGKYEAIDQIATAHYLQTLPYVDKDRIGIWGWSFGGYLSSLAMFKGEGTFKMAMAVAPVTNWRYYDNIYTERFLQKPQDNPDGYDDNSPCFFADRMEGKYLLVHGTADDNVHFQNAMDLVTELNVAEKQYEQFFYPNKNHFIYGGNTRFQLYTKLTNFVLENL